MKWKIDVFGDVIQTRVTQKVIYTRIERIMCISCAMTLCTFWTKPEVSLYMSLLPPHGRAYKLGFNPGTGSTRFQWGNRVPGNRFWANRVTGLSFRQKRPILADFGAFLAIFWTSKVNFSKSVQRILFKFCNKLLIMVLEAVYEDGFAWIDLNNVSLPIPIKKSEI